jgi:hypothetical protein
MDTVASAILRQLVLRRGATKRIEEKHYEMASELEPHHIGRIGERQFEVLCERAGLYCNKSVVNVMG